MSSSSSSPWLDDIDRLLRSLSSSPKSSSMAAWIYRRNFVERLATSLPDRPLHCDLLLRLLRLASAVGVEPPVLASLESRAAPILDQASLEELLIPAFSHTSGTLLDVDMALRLVRGFVSMEEAARTAAANAKVAKLVDGYLAEVAVDINLKLADFEALAVALPGHARASDDGLYRAIDTYLKVHPTTTKQERKTLFRLIDTRKLSSEASQHAAQNDRLPVRAAIQILLSDQHSRSFGGSFSGPRSPSGAQLDLSSSSARCPSKREPLQQEVRKLREDVARLQVQCQWLQGQLERAACVEKRKAKKKGSGYYSMWRSWWYRGGERLEEEEDGISSSGRRSRFGAGGGDGILAKRTPPKWRNSTST